MPSLVDDIASLQLAARGRVKLSAGAPCSADMDAGIRGDGAQCWPVLVGRRGSVKDLRSLPTAGRGSRS
jgi:hypothetical protein